MSTAERGIGSDRRRSNRPLSTSSATPTAAPVPGEHGAGRGETGDEEVDVGDVAGADRPAEDVAEDEQEHRRGQRPDDEQLRRAHELAQGAAGDGGRRVDDARSVGGCGDGDGHGHGLLLLQAATSSSVVDVSSAAGRPVRVRKTSSSVGPAQADVVELDAGVGEQAHGIGQAGGAVVDGHGDTASGVVDARVLAAERCEQLDRAAEVVVAADADLHDVAPGQRLQLVRRARGDRTAMVDDDHMVGELVGLLEVLRRQQHVGAAVDEGADGVPQVDPAARVEPGGRLVEEQQARRADEAGPQVEAPAHAARVVANQAVAVVGQADLVEHRVGGVTGGRPPVPEQAGDHHQVLPASQRRLDGGVLAGETDHPADLVRAGDGVDAGDGQRALVGRGQRGDRAYERGLAGAVGPEHGGDRTRRGEKVEAVERGDVAEALAQAVSLDGCGAGVGEVLHATIVRRRSGHVMTTSGARLWPCAPIASWPPSSCSRPRVA